MFTFALLEGELGALLLPITTGDALTNEIEWDLWGVTLATLQAMLGDLYLHGGVCLP